MPTEAKARKKPAKPRTTSKPAFVPLREALTSDKSKLHIKRKKDGSLDLDTAGPPGIILALGVGFALIPYFAPNVLPWSAILLGVLLATGIVWFIHPWFDRRPAAGNYGANQLRLRKRGSTRTLATQGLVASILALLISIGLHVWLHPGADLALGLSFGLTAAIGIGLVVRYYRGPVGSRT